MFIYLFLEYLRLKNIIILTLLIAILLPACSLKPDNNIYISSNDVNETFDPNLGVVEGKIYLLTSERQIPVKGQILYLAEVINDGESNPSFAAFDRINSPRAVTDNNGHFKFLNVQPGYYGFVLDVITNSYLLMKPGTQEPIIIEVSGGEKSDLGDLVYDELPIIIGE